MNKQELRDEYIKKTGNDTELSCKSMSCCRIYFSDDYVIHLEQKIIDERDRVLKVIDDKVRKILKETISSGLLNGSADTDDFIEKKLQELKQKIEEKSDE